LKATGLQASDLVKAKVKKTKSSSSSKAASYAGNSSPSHSDAGKPVVDNYSDAVNGNDSVSGVYANAANGLVAGTTLPHFSQVWSSTAQDVVFNADQLLAQMTNPTGHAQSALYHGNGTAVSETGVLLPSDDNQHLPPAIYQYVLSPLRPNSTRKIPRFSHSKCYPHNICFWKEMCSCQLVVGKFATCWTCRGV